MPHVTRASVTVSTVGLVLITASGVRAGVLDSRATRVMRTDSASITDSLQDPALTTGTLPNGMRYYLRANAMPAHRAELRLVVDAGSRLEDEDQRGFAHFLEHMAFNGTRRFPRNSFVDFIETSGMRFGADLNASTDFDETIYTVTLPTDDGTTLGKGLDVLQDWASGGITIDSGEVAAERGVIMGEWRTRLPDTASQTVNAHYDTLLFGTSRYLTRKAIGDTTLIETARPGPIRRFYDDWYLPNRMAVVVIGDFDQAQMVREIRERFGRIPSVARPRAYTPPSLPANAETVVDVYRHNLTPSAELLWPAPVRPRGAKAGMRQRIVTELLMEELEQRLLKIREQPSRPFITAELERGRIVRPLNLVGVQIITWPDSMERALATVVGEIERVAQHGVPRATLDHRKAVLLRHYESAAASATALSSKAIADSYVSQYLTGDGSLLSSRQELTLVQDILPEITPEVLAREAHFWREPAGRKVFVRLPLFDHARPPTRESVLALFDSVQHATLAADSAPPSSQAPLIAKLPAPGKIVGEKYDTVAGITEWTLSNGARVLLKPTRNDPDQLLVRAWSPGGFSVLPDSLFFTPGRMVAQVMTDVGGLGAIGHDALEEKISTSGLRTMKVDIGYANESIQLDGSPRELETLFQMLYLQFTAPILDSTALHGWQSLAKYQVTGLTLDDEFNQIFARGEPRMLPVSTSIAELATIPQLMDVYHDRFGNAAEFTFTFVGAVTPAEVRPLVERYIASLPSTKKRDRAAVSEVRPFLHRVNSTLPVLELPDAQTLLVFDGLFPTQPDAYLRGRQELSALTIVLQSRLRERLRRQLGGTYSPFIGSETLALQPEHYRVTIGFDAAPERMRALNKELMSIVDSVRTHGVSSAEAERVTIVQQRQLETSLQDNSYWMAGIGTYDRLGISLNRIPSPFGNHRATPAEIQDAAKRYLPDDVYIHVTMMPKDTASYARRDSAATAP